MKDPLVRVLMRWFKYWEIGPFDPRHPNTTKKFHDSIDNSLPAQAVVLDLGCGKSDQHHRRELFKDKIQLVGGMDIDRNVEMNKDLDFVCRATAYKLPFTNQIFDLVWADYVLEHLSTPTVTFNEVFRVLKPGGCFVFRTPNLGNYVAIIAKTVPSKFYKTFLNIGGRNSEDAYPTYFKANRLKDLTYFAKKEGFRIQTVSFVDGGPSYLEFFFPLYLLGSVFQYIINMSHHFRYLRSNIIMILEKPNK
jgi:SAM-dependent methyltransferase